MIFGREDHIWTSKQNTFGLAFNFHYKKSLWTEC